MTVDLEFRRNLTKLQHELLPALERKIYYENIKSAVATMGGKPIRYLVYDKNDKVPWFALKRYGGVTDCGNILNLPRLPTEEVLITDSFWTCECHDHFIHHKAQYTCPICKLTRQDDTKILRILKG